MMATNANNARPVAAYRARLRDLYGSGRFRVTAAGVVSVKTAQVGGWVMLGRLGDAFLDRHLFADAAPEVMAEVPPGATVDGAGTGEGSPASSWAGLVKIGPRRVLLCTHREASGRRLLSLSPGASAAALAGFGPWFVRPLDQVKARQADASPGGFDDARGQS